MTFEKVKEIIAETAHASPKKRSYYQHEQLWQNLYLQLSDKIVTLIKNN